MWEWNSDNRSDDISWIPKSVFAFSNSSGEDNQNGKKKVGNTENHSTVSPASKKLRSLCASKVHTRH